MTVSQKIAALKARKNVVILAHYYESAEVADCADIVGDSFALAKKAASLDCKIIVVCGVRFMAESVKLLNPDKKVLLPANDAGCPMADSITPEDIRRLRRENPGAAAVCYVNSTAAVKAECDVCCTSSNAVKVAASLKEKTIIFVPDANLGRFVAARVPDKRFVYFGKGCPIHGNITATQVQSAMQRHPDALFAAHPECDPSVVALADYAGSTAGIIEFAKTNPSRDIIIGTEEAIAGRLREMFPQNDYFLLSPSMVCADMKKTTAEVLAYTLENECGEVVLPPKTVEKAALPLRRMIAVG